MKTVHLYIDNLRIGGFQRLCLDQAYAFSDSGFQVQIHVLGNENASEPSFLTSESSLIYSHRLQIHFLSEKLGQQFSEMFAVLRVISPNDILISHSLRATALLWLSRKFTFRRISFLTTIHQLPTLSAPKQRFKRFVYAQLSPILTGYSVAVIQDWKDRVGHFPKGIRWVFSKEINLLRNGIYLPRITNQKTLESSVFDGRIIFLGRITSWKGLDTFFEFARHPKLERFELLVIVPEITSDLQSNLRSEYGGRIQFQIGGSFNTYSPRKGDVHFYAAQYGDRANYIESVSLNCLEMASVGVPSVVTKAGLGTWPELSKFNLFWECSWANFDETSDSIIKASKMAFDIKDMTEIRNLIDINRNVNSIIEIN